MIDTEKFLEQLILKAMPDADKDEIEMMIEETEPTLYNRIITHIAEQIDDEKGQATIDILENEWVTPEVAEYLKTNIPNFQEFLEKTYKEFETMYLKEFEVFDKEFGDETLEDE